MTDTTDNQASEILKGILGSIDPKNITEEQEGVLKNLAAKLSGQILVGELHEFIGSQKDINHVLDLVGYDIHDIEQAILQDTAVKKITDEALRKEVVEDASAIATALIAMRVENLTTSVEPRKIETVTDNKEYERHLRDAAVYGAAGGTEVFDHDLVEDNIKDYIEFAMEDLPEDTRRLVVEALIPMVQSHNIAAAKLYGAL